MAVVGLKNLCTPAYVYLVFSLIIAFIIYYNDNYNNIDIDCLGMSPCDKVYLKHLYTVIKVLFIFFWAWILNIICSSGSTYIAWALVIIPFLTSLAMITLFWIG